MADNNRETKENTIATLLNLGDESKETLASASDETLDQVTNAVINNMNEGTINEQVDDIIRCVEAMNRPEDEVADCIHAFTGMKFNEASEIYRDILRERTKKSTPMGKILEKIG